MLQIQLNQETTTTNQLNKAAPNSNETTLHRILQEKFNEFENTFRNLILIDGVIFRITNLLWLSTDFKSLFIFNLFKGYGTLSRAVKIIQIILYVFGLEQRVAINI